MGLDAYVLCRCWQDGLTSEPPVPAELIGVDKEGNFGLLDDQDDRWLAVDMWRKNACPHEDMEFASEWVANWSGYRLFRDALATVGWQHFPTLRTELPEANGGMMPAAAAVQVLAELDFFATQDRLGEETVLLDEDTGDVVMTHVPAYDGEVMLGPGYRAGVDRDGFFVRDDAREAARTLFRSRRFSQVVRDAGMVEFSDAECTAVVKMPPVDAAPDEQPVPRRLRVETRPRTAADFVHIVQRLRTLCLAAKETGNPVVWT